MYLRNEVFKKRDFCMLLNCVGTSTGITSLAISISFLRFPMKLCAVLVSQTIIILTIGLYIRNECIEKYICSKYVSSKELVIT